MSQIFSKSKLFLQSQMDSTLAELTVPPSSIENAQTVLAGEAHNYITEVTSQ